MNILICLDDNYVSYYLVMLASLLENNKQSYIHVFLIKYMLPSDDGVNRIRKLIEKYENSELVIVCLQRDIIDALSFAELAQWPIEAYFRLIAPWVLDESVDRILYLDGDIIINGDILSFYQSDLSNKSVGACLDCAMKDYAHRFENDKERIKNEKELELYRSLATINYDTDYVNGGVLLQNLTAIRRKYTLTQLLEFIKHYNPILRYPDQDIINWFYREDMKVFDFMEYNCQTGAISYQYELQILEKARIIHLTGKRPWEYDYRNRYSSAIKGDIWWRYACRAGVKSNGEYVKWKIINACITKPWILLFFLKSLLLEGVWKKCIRDN